MSMKWSGRTAAILAGGVLFSWATFAAGQGANDSDCVVSQNGACLDALIQNAPANLPSPKPAAVTFKRGRLTITAEGISLREILSAVGSQAGVDITLPQQGLEEKVVVHLGPGPMRDVLVELLNGSSFNYVMLSSPTDPTVLQHLVLSSRGAMPSDGAIAASPTPVPPVEAAGLPSEIDPVVAARNADWASGRGKIIDQMMKQRIRQREAEQRGDQASQPEEEQPQQAPPQQPGLPQQQPATQPAPPQPE
jgi:hypothetical protein